MIRASGTRAQDTHQSSNALTTSEVPPTDAKVARDEKQSKDVEVTRCHLINAALLSTLDCITIVQLLSSVGLDETRACIARYFHIVHRIISPLPS